MPAFWWVGVVLVAGQALAADATQTTASQSFEDVEVLLRVGQLQEWLGAPLTLAEGLCIQQSYGMRWPAAPTGPAGAREEDMLRLAREHCASALGSGGEAQRLVTEAKLNFRERLQRLYGLRLTIQACLNQHADAPAAEVCVVQAAARPLSAQEQRWLMAATVR